MRFKIKNMVNKLIKKYETRDPYELASYLDIVLVEKPLGTMCGSYFYINRNKVIFLNSSLSDYEKIIVLSHEIGHAILHRKDNCYFMKNKTLLLTSKIEKEANVFAAEYLIPDELLQNYKDYTIKHISLNEHLPIELLQLKFFYNNNGNIFY